MKCLKRTGLLGCLLLPVSALGLSRRPNIELVDTVFLQSPVCSAYKGTRYLRGGGVRGRLCFMHPA